MKRMARGLMLVLSISSVCFVAPVASGQRSPLRVAVGDTGATVGGDAVADALELALHHAIAVESGRLVEALPLRARYVVTGSVTELDEREEDGEHEVRIAVSLVVADRGGSVRAMLAGRAGARGGDRASLTEHALLAAVRSAIRPLGTTLR